MKCMVYERAVGLTYSAPCPREAVVWMGDRRGAMVALCAEHARSAEKAIRAGEVKLHGVRQEPGQVLLRSEAW